MSRRMAREIAFKTLFQYDIGNNLVEPTLTELLSENNLSEESANFARELVNGTITNLEEIDSVLSDNLVNWTLPRLAGVDRSILRLAAFELLFRDDIPGAVAINEAIEIGKTYNDLDSPKFLNGILDKIAQAYGKKAKQD